MAKEEVKTKEMKEPAVAETIETDNAKAIEVPTPVAKPKKSRAKRSVPQGQAHILASFNNTIVTITDPKGNVLSSASAGSSGFRGSKKGTAYAAQIAAEKAIDTAKQNYGISKLEVLIKGIGLGREAAVRTLINQKIEVEGIKDVTSIAHGGVRPRKARRT
jgi:small subunit ribosomal protein S11